MDESSNLTVMEEGMKRSPKLEARSKRLEQPGGFLETEFKIHDLDRLSAGSLDEIIDDRRDDEILRPFVIDRGDIAPVGAGNVFGIRIRACRKE